MIGFWAVVKVGDGAVAGAGCTVGVGVGVGVSCAAGALSKLEVFSGAGLGLKSEAGSAVGSADGVGIELRSGLEAEDCGAVKLDESGSAIESLSVVGVAL